MILVAGATGALGGTVTRGLLAAGHDVRVLVRAGSDYGGLLEAGAEPVMGDLKDPESLARACAGIDTVVTTANSAARSAPDTVAAVDLAGNRSLIDAAAAAGVGHFVFVSTIGASEDSPVEFFAAKGAAEAHLRASGMTHTILEPNLFVEVWAGMLIGIPVADGRPVTLVEPARARHTFVSRADVAAFTIAAARQAEGRNETVLIGGPDALSWRDVVALAGEALGRELEVAYVAPGAPLPGLPEMASHMAAAMEGYESVFDTATPAAAFGVRLTPIAECLKQMLRPVTAD